MRTPSPVIYAPDYTFEFGKAYVPYDAPDAAAVIVSSGRGVHEAVAAASQCASRSVSVGAVDMSSIDEELLIGLCRSSKLICLAEQNNGYILQNLFKIVYRRCPDVATSALQRVLSINTLDPGGRSLRPFRHVRGAHCRVRPGARANRRRGRQRSGATRACRRSAEREGGLQ